MRRQVIALMLVAGLGGVAGAEPPVENLPPDCSGAEPGVARVWPPNHRLVDVAVLGVVDPDGDPVAVTVTGIAQDEPLDGTGDGSTCPDGFGVGTARASVRAERSGRGDGRVYHVAFAAEDARGGACTGVVRVCVPHDQRPGGECGDQGPLVDSAGDAPPPCEGDCDPEDCMPSSQDMAPAACRGERLPTAFERRVSRARALLERAVRRGGRAGARRLALRAAKQLRKAAAVAGRAAAREDVSAPCEAALRQRLEAAGGCVACAAY